MSLTTPIFHDVAVIRGHRGTTSPYRGAQGGALIHGQRPLRYLDRPPKGLIQMTHGSHDAPPPLHAFRMNIQPRVFTPSAAQDAFRTDVRRKVAKREGRVMPGGRTPCIHGAVAAAVSIFTCGSHHAIFSLSKSLSFNKEELHPAVRHTTKHSQARAPQHSA